MEINKNVYGLSENWINAVVNFNNNDNKNKLANFMNAPLSSINTSVSQIWRGVSEGKLTYGVPIDNSLSYCGLGNESAMSHVNYIGYNNGVKVLNTDDRGASNFVFFERRRRENSFVPYSTDVYPITDLIRRNRLQSIAWIENPVNNFCLNSSPIVKINPKNICFLIQVNAGKAINSSGWIDFDTFKNDTDYKYFYAARIVPYFSNNGATGRTQNADASATTDGEYNFFVNLIENYNIPDWDFSKNIYSYVNNVVFGNLMGANVGYYTTNNDYINIAYLTPTAKDNLHFITENQPTGNYVFYIDRYEELAEEILKTVACFGLYFTTNTGVALNGSLTHNDMYIGLIDGDGVGRGKYLRGTETENAPQNQYSDMHEINYNPNADYDKTKYNNSTHFNLNLSLGAFTKFYQLTESQVNDLCDALYEAVNSQPSGTSIEEYNMKCFLTNNPIDCIISLKKFPLNHFPTVGTPNDLYLGTVDTGIDAPLVLSTTWIYYFDFSNSSDTGLYPINGSSFLDFEPYTTIQINVPFCGSFEVPTTYFHKYGGVRVALMIDFITGACTAYLMVNNDVVDSVSGSCSVDLPVTGLQSATLDGNIHNASMMKEKQQTSLFGGLIAGAVSIGVGIATGSVPLAVGGGAAIVGSFMNAEDTGKQINYNVEHMQLPIKQVGAASGAISQCNDYRCKMIIKRPVLMDYDKEIYASTIGYACLLNGIVNDFTGLTIGKIEVETIQNGITDEERAMIDSLFASGVIL